MKPIKNLVQTWDRIEEEIRILRWVQHTFLEPQFETFVEEACAECGADLFTEAERMDWRAVKEFHSLRDLVQLLLRLRATGQSIPDYLHYGLLPNQESPPVSSALKFKSSPEQLN
jgi:hypothetical protein